MTVLQVQAWLAGCVATLLLTGCGGPAARPITQASDDGLSCEQLRTEADRLALEAVEAGTKAQSQAGRKAAFQVLSFVPLVGDVAGVADAVGDVSGSRAASRDMLERDWASARSVHLRELEGGRCSATASNATRPPVAPPAAAAAAP